MLAYQSSTSTRVNLGGSFVAGQQVNVFLTDINKATGTYNIAWTSSGGDNGSVSNITLTNAAATSEDWNFISFGEASNVISTSQLYVDNILVTAVPEPSTYAALAGLGAIGLAVLSRRRSRG